MPERVLWRGGAGILLPGGALDGGRGARQAAALPVAEARRRLAAVLGDPAVRLADVAAELAAQAHGAAGADEEGAIQARPCCRAGASLRTCAASPQRLGGGRRGGGSRRGGCLAGAVPCGEHAGRTAPWPPGTARAHAWTCCEACSAPNMRARRRRAV